MGCKASKAVNTIAVIISIAKTQVRADANPEKYTHDDNEDYEEDYETHISRTHPAPKVQEGIDFINKVLAKGKPYCDPDFTPNLVPSYIREDEMDKMRNDALPKD
jgi:hypothetical protein